MTAPVELKALSTPSELVEASRIFNLSQLFGPVLETPKAAPAELGSPPVGSVAAIITLKSVFGAEEEVEFRFIRGEMKIAIDWASSWSNGGVLAFNSRVCFVSEPGVDDDATASDDEASLFAKVTRKDPVMRFFVVPYQPAEPGQEGRGRYISIEEALGNMAEARFGPEGRERHVEALVASWSEYLAGEARGEDGVPYRVEPFLSAIDAHVASMTL